VVLPFVRSTMTHGGCSSPGSNRIGSYELLRPIAHGGMADIYLARHEGIGHLERRVAIKILNEHRAIDPDARALFLHEARVCALLHHQNIASVLEVDVANGRYYLAMEYVDGVDLRDLVAEAARAGRGVPYEAAIAIVSAAAAGLDHAHRRCDAGGNPLRLVHRDVSLSNIMVGHDGSVKVVDFGIASTTISDVHTMPGVVRGKASYMSPEQCLGDPLDHRTDVFALGIVLYELTTGARCFHGKSDFERMLAVVRSDYLAPSQIVPDYPPELARVVRTALATAPGDRYASCAELIDALAAVLAARGLRGGTQPIARLMAELYGASRATEHMPAPVAAPPVDETAAEPAATARQPVLLEMLAESGAIPPHALAIASAPTAPKQPLARGSTRVARGTCTEAYEKQTRELWLDDDDDARTRGRRALKRSIASRRPGASPKLAA
jgi:eukaryotic-like serine/threonine-protein kinase